MRKRLGMEVAREYLGIVKYDAKAGRFSRVDKDQLGQTVLGDLTGKPVAFDTGGLEVGWLKFGLSGPERVMVPIGQDPPPQPVEVGADGKLTHKPGFYCKVAGQAVDGIRELCSSTGILIDAVDTLWQQVEAAPEAHLGQIPLIVVTGSTPVTTGTGARRATNYRPVIEIRGWVDRPVELGERTVPAPKPQANGAPTTTASAAPPTGDPTIPLAQQQQPAPVQQPAVVAATNLPVDKMPF
jgi:hypothetical protein